MGWALFWVTSTSVIQKKDVFNVWNQSFTDGDPVKTAVFPLSFHKSFRLPNLITRGGTPRPLGSCALFQGLIVFFNNPPMDEAREFQLIFMSLRTWGSEPFRVITQRYASSLRSPQIEDTRAASYLVEKDLAKIALFCHFPRDLLCYKEGLPLHDDAMGTTAHGVPYVSVAPLATLASSCLARRCKISVPRFLTFSCWCNFLSCISISICGFGKNGHHLSQGRHAVFLRPGHDLRSYLPPEKSFRR